MVTYSKLGELFEYSTKQYSTKEGTSRPGRPDPCLEPRRAMTHEILHQRSALAKRLVHPAPSFHELSKYLPLALPRGQTLLFPRAKPLRTAALCNLQTKTKFEFGL